MIDKILKNMGITSRYRGYEMIKDAVAIYKTKRDVKITKDIYPILAKKYDIAPASVEKDIRIVIEVCWRTNRNAVITLMGHYSEKHPTNSVFLKALSKRVNWKHQ